ncbi:MAG TPA: hypothetical protein VG347_19335 [Verrucomicrobiae bacterium]|nr:hypothetical protein [Verrucomicrobiae bacterium]
MSCESYLVEYGHDGVAEEDRHGREKESPDVVSYKLRALALFYRAPTAKIERIRLNPTKSNLIYLRFMNDDLRLCLQAVIAGCLWAWVAGESARGLAHSKTLTRWRGLQSGRIAI